MRIRLLTVALFALHAAACGEEDTSTPADASPDTASDAGGDVAADAATDGTVDTTPDVADVPEELDLTPDPDCTEGTWLVRIGGTVQLDDGSTEEGLKAQVCLRRAASDVAICLRPQNTAADGSFAVLLPENERCVEQVSLRILKVASTYATTYCHVELEGAGADHVVPEPFVLFDTSDAVSRPALGEATASRDVELLDGVVLSVVPSALESDGSAEDTYEALRAVQVDPASTATCFVDPADGFAGLIGFDPESNVTGSSFDITLPNPTGIAAGAEVEILVQGGLFVKNDRGELVPEADWVRGGLGTVSEDGATIVATAAVPGLNWLAWRPMP